MIKRIIKRMFSDLHETLKYGPMRVVLVILAMGLFVSEKDLIGFYTFLLLMQIFFCVNDIKELLKEKK